MPLETALGFSRLSVYARLALGHHFGAKARNHAEHLGHGAWAEGRRSGGETAQFEARKQGMLSALCSHLGDISPSMRRPGRTRRKIGKRRRVRVCAPIF